MDTTLIVGVILFAGFICGELAQRIMLPRVTGYIIAGVLLNPQLLNFIPADISKHTDFVTNISLSFITFSIGGSLLFSHIRKLGRSIVSITLFEAEVTFIVVTFAVALILPFLSHNLHGDFLHTFLPLGLIIGALASPTDPTGTLAVKHQYKSKGDVTSTVLSVSAFDDALGLMNFSIAVVIAQVLVLHQDFSVANSLGKPLAQIFGAFAVGTMFGLVFNVICKFIRKDTEGVLIVVIFSLLGLCFGLAGLLKVDELLATMTMGIIVTNYNKHRERVFEILERYAEEIVFVLFFTLSGMYLNFTILATTAVGVLLYAVARTIGKFSGTYIGAAVGGSSPLVRRYTGYGLIPSGGIIVGLALLLKQNPAFHSFADAVINVVIGATVIHELVGPILVQIAFRRSGEIHKG